MPLIDTHAHIDQVDNIDDALKDAWHKGVEAVIAVGIDCASSMENFNIQKRIDKPKIHVAIGIHPENLEVYDEQEIEKCMNFIKENRKDAVAIGEIGLDYWYKWARKDNEKKQQQREVFSKQLSIAKEAGMPAIIHSRGAWSDCFEAVKEIGISKAVFHWYSGPLEVLENILSCGYFISVTPSLHYSKDSQEAVKKTPIEQLLIETDSPVYYRYGESGFSATPKDVFKTLELYSKLTGLNEQEAGNILYQNAKRFFGISDEK